MPGRVQQNEAHVKHCIDEVIDYGFYVIKRRLSFSWHPSKRQSDNITPFLSKYQALWLGKHAFQTVLQYRRKEYDQIVIELKRELSCHPRCTQLEDIADRALKCFDMKSFVLS